MSSKHLEPGTVHRAVELVDYGNQAIVSRILLKTQGGSATIFAFDAEQELSEHTTPFDALVHVIEGQGEFRVGSETHTVDAGGLILLPANIPHAVRASDRFKMILTMLR